MRKLKVVLIGAGGRGNNYTSYMTEDKFSIIAVAEPIKERRESFKQRYNISDDLCFDTWEKLLEKPKMADVAVIATSDSDHYAPAMKAIAMGYNLLLEKPIAPTAKECVDIANFAAEKGVKILVCHVLRYTPFFTKIKSMIRNNDIGKIISIHHSECVGHLHQSHSYVRGNWGNTEKSSSMLLAKSCHDIDIIQWLIDSKCSYVQSFGSLSFFKKENAPEGAPDYCIEGCPYKDECYYNATAMYSVENDEWFKKHALQKENPTQAELENLLRNTQYGKCVFKCDNDVVDHQVVNLEYENGAVASFNMSAFNHGGRYIRIMGTDGEIYGDMTTNTLDYYSFKTDKHTIINPWEKNLNDSITTGHAGGDGGLVEILYKYMAEDYNGDMLSEIAISAENHLTVFAAEKSRLEKKVVNINEFNSENGLVIR